MRCLTRHLGFCGGTKNGEGLRTAYYDLGQNGQHPEHPRNLTRGSPGHERARFCFLNSVAKKLHDTRASDVVASSRSRILMAGASPASFPTSEILSRPYVYINPDMRCVVPSGIPTICRATADWRASRTRIRVAERSMRERGLRVQAIQSRDGIARNTSDAVRAQARRPRSDLWSPNCLGAIRFTGRRSNFRLFSLQNQRIGHVTNDAGVGA